MSVQGLGSAQLLAGGARATTATLPISLLPVNDPPAFALPLAYLQRGLRLPASAPQGATATLAGVCPFDVDSNATLLRVCISAEVGALSLHAAEGVVVEAGACRADARADIDPAHRPRGAARPRMTP